MIDFAQLIIERVKELNLPPDQKFKVELSEDIMHEVLCAADNSGTKYMKLEDGTYTFWIDGPNYWSPKVWCIDSLPKGTFNITLTDK